MTTEIQALPGCPIASMIDAVSVARAEERLTAIHEQLKRIEDAVLAQNGRLRTVEEGQSRLNGVAGAIGGFAGLAGLLTLGAKLAGWL